MGILAQKNAETNLSSESETANYAHNKNQHNKRAKAQAAFLAVSLCSNHGSIFCAFNVKEFVIVLDQKPSRSNTIPL